MKQPDHDSRKDPRVAVDEGSAYAVKVPSRIQRRRTRGWTMPDGAVYVGRPTKWGNPFRIDIDGSAAACVDKYRKRIGGNVWTYPNKWDIKENLRGKDLVCWCPLDKPCHADVLLEIANS